MNSKRRNLYKFYSPLVFFLIVYLVSCAKPSIVVVDKTIAEIGSLESSEVLSLLREQEEKIHSVSGLALARLKSPEQKVSFKQVTIVQAPNKLRLEALAPLGTTELAVISDGNKVLLKFPEKDVLYNQFEAFNFSVFYPNIPVPININHLSAFLLGQIPPSLYDDDYTVDIDEQGKVIILTSKSSENRLWIDFDYFRIKKASFIFENSEKITVHYDEFKPLESVYFPREIELDMQRYSIYIKYDYDVDINTNIRQSLFNIDL